METLDKIISFCNSIITERDKDENYFAFPPEGEDFCIINFINGRWSINYRHTEKVREMGDFPFVNMYSYEVMLPYSVNIVEILALSLIMS